MLKVNYYFNNFVFFLPLPHPALSWTGWSRNDIRSLWAGLSCDFSGEGISFSTETENVIQTITFESSHLFLSLVRKKQLPRMLWFCYSVKFNWDTASKLHLNHLLIIKLRSQMLICKYLQQLEHNASIQHTETRKCWIIIMYLMLNHLSHNSINIFTL